LRLFTSARFSSLDGMPFPAPRDHFPTKDEMADYLEHYAAHFELPILSGVRVLRLLRATDGYTLVTAEGTFSAKQVIVAMANHQQEKTPEFAQQLAPEITQLHTLHYKNPAQLRPGPVLIVGAGNSGAEIAMELSKTRHVYLSGHGTGVIPFRVEGLLARKWLVPLVLRVIFHRVLTIRTAIGRKLRPKILHRGGPLVRVKPWDLRRAGVERVGRTSGVQDGLPVLEDGRVLEVPNVIWCCGFSEGFSWIELPVFDETGLPRHEGGVVPEAPGLYFVGLHFGYSMSSEMIHGVGRDAARIASLAVARRPELSPVASLGSEQMLASGAWAAGCPQPGRKPDQAREVSG
jgi:putative flavoprotein involved in K+ transport